MPNNLLLREKQHLANLLEAIQRCVYFLNAAHDYEINYADVADHFNTLNTLTRNLYQTARRFVIYCESELGVCPGSPDFSEEFYLITK